VRVHAHKESNKHCKIKRKTMSTERVMYGHGDLGATRSREIASIGLGN